MGNLQVVDRRARRLGAVRRAAAHEVLAALPVMMLGVVLISGIIGSGAYGVDPQLGVAIGLLTAVAYAGYLLIIRRATPDRRPAAPVAIATAVTAVCAGLFGTAVGDLDLTPGMPADAYLIALGSCRQSVGLPRDPGLAAAPARRHRLGPAARASPSRPCSSARSCCASCRRRSSCWASRW